MNELWFENEECHFEDEESDGNGSVTFSFQIKIVGLNIGHVTQLNLKLIAKHQKTLLLVLQVDYPEDDSGEDDFDDLDHDSDYSGYY